MHRIYFLDREAPRPGAAVHAAIEIRNLGPVEYRSHNEFGDYVCHPAEIDRDEAADLLRLARFEGWWIKRVNV